jgi:hypothetical protein
MAYLTDAKKEAPEQLVVTQELPWSGRQDSNHEPENVGPLRGVDGSALPSQGAT